MEPTPKKSRFDYGPSDPIRALKACVICNQKKVKCSGTKPCSYCEKRSLTCTYSQRNRMKSFPVDYVQNLEQRAGLHTTSIQNQNSKSTRAGVVDRSETMETVDLTNQAIADTGSDSHAEFASSGVMGVTYARNARKVRKSSFSLDLPMSSSIAFGSQVKALRQDDPQGSLPGVSFNDVPPAVEDWTGLWRRWPEHAANDKSTILPDEDVGQSYLDRILLSVGEIQHFFDPRVISDRIAQNCRMQVPQAHRVDLEYLEMLLVFAVAEILNGTWNGKQPPGFQYFLEAHSKIPNLALMRRAGIIAIEVLGLAAFYLQCIGERDDAFVYSGTALRLCLSEGLSRPPTTHVSRFEREHRNRLWWTIYMQERRLSAAVGQPLSVEDDVIRVALPSKTPGLTSPEAMRVNVSICQVTGRILKTVYGQNLGSEREFVANVQSILESLTKIRTEMPKPYSDGLTEPWTQINRVGATLLLMLFQAVCLCTRPVLLQVARSNLTSQQAGSNYLTSAAEPVQALTKACIDSAHNMLRILRALQSHKLLVTFGFFDLDASYSVAFVFVLAATIRRNDSGSLRSLDQTCTLLQYFVDHGNSSARSRKADIDQMRRHLSIPHRNASTAMYGASTRVSNNRQSDSQTQSLDPMQGGSILMDDTNQNMVVEQFHNANENNLNSPMIQHNLAQEGCADEQNLWATCDPPRSGTGISPLLDLSYLQETSATGFENMWGQEGDIYQVYNDEDFCLTGVVQYDWAQLISQIPYQSP